MTFWIVATLLALIIAGVLLLGLTRGARDGLTGAESDMAVYRDQLDEIARDLERGVLGAEEAEAAKLEVSRRLLDADKRLSESRELRAGGQTLALLLIPAVVLAGGGALYAVIGAPGTRDAPIEARIARIEEARANRPGQIEVETRAIAALPQPEEVDPEFLALMERLRAALEERPDDVAGLMLLAQNEARLGNYAAARAAQERIVAVKGERATPRDLADTVELMVALTGGYISPEAETYLKRLLDLEPRHGTGRYYLGLLQVQSGRPDLAFPVWRRLYEESRPNAPWLPVLEAELENLASAAGVRYRLPERADVPGPTAEDMAAASDMSEDERQAMIESMVEGLAERLGAEGGPPEEWARLISALSVMGQTERARAIYDEARQVWAGDEDALVMLQEAGIAAGIVE